MTHPSTAARRDQPLTLDLAGKLVTVGLSARERAHLESAAAKHGLALGPYLARLVDWGNARDAAARCGKPLGEFIRDVSLAAINLTPLGDAIVGARNRL